MYRLLIIIGLFSQIAFGQSDGCSSATLLNVTANCSSPINGTTNGATETIPGCVGNADDDVWYQFVATATSHQINVVPAAGMDPVVQLFSGGCGTLTSLICKDSGLDGEQETINYTSLSIGVTYRIRVYNYFAGSGTGNFTICVTNPPPAPSNDACSTPISLLVNSSCTYTNGTTNGATQSYVGCAGFADDDVWFSFVATNSLQNINVHPLSNLDLVFQVYSGTCGSLVSIDCEDNTLTAQDEQTNIVGLVPGQTYLVRVYDYYDGITGDFQICVTGTPTAVPTNDEPCSAIQLPAVTSSCQFSQFTTVGATASTATAPTPSTCVGGSGAAIGGFNSGTKDVWFSITVPASGNVDVTAQPNGGAGSITDGVMALYSGSCSTLTQIACSDDNNYPGSANDLLPLISASGLTPGSTVFLRYWAFGSGSGTFGICVSTATNDDCANALYICDINGYSSSTSASYTPDRPGNMRGNNEDINGVNMPDGVNTGGIFGQGGSWGSGAPNFDVIINNNSWIKFTAASATATLTVNIYDCWIGNYPSGGVQMQIFEGTNCTNFIPVSNFEESSTGFTITANNLTVGNDYYLMVDGYAGDICNYTITAESGVQFPDIADVPPLCSGQSVTLTAPAGASSYSWTHNGASTPTVNVTPSTTSTYYCEVTGLCDYKQILDVTVVVNPNPTVAISNGSTVQLCTGNNVVLTGTGANSYSWSSVQSTPTATVSPTTNTTYTVTGTDLNGCTNTANTLVNVNALPTLTTSPTSTDSDCGSSNGALNGAIGSGANPINYNWTDGSSTVGSTPNLTNVPAGTYFLNLSDANLCVAQFGPFNISNPGAPPSPSILIDDSTPCLNDDIILTASNALAGVTFNWTGPSGFTSSNAIINLNNVTSSQQGNYCVSSTIAGCTGPSICQNVSVLASPTIDVLAAGNDSTICINGMIDLSATGGNSYMWSGPNSFSSNLNLISINNANSLNAGYYIVTGIDGNGCTNVDSILISILDLPTLNLTTDNSNGIYCGGNIANVGATGAEQYSWAGPNGFSSNNQNITIFGLQEVNQGYYSVTGTDANGCNNLDSIYLNIVTDVPANSPNDTTICPGDVIILYGSGGTSYTWSGPVGFYSEEQNPLVTTNAGFEEDGYYYLTIVDANGCLGYDSTLITVSNNSDCLFIPNIFTPDKDGKNDFWEIQGIDKYLDNEVEIYNRWGNLIYAAKPYLNDWFGDVNKGTTIENKSGKVPVGTYFYIIRLNDGSDKPDYKGYVEIQY